MALSRKRLLILNFAVLGFCLFQAACFGQAEEEPTAAERLALSQEQLADKYKRLEMLMLKMAEVDATENPQRSALLKNAIRQSKKKFIKDKMNELARILQQQRFRNAIEGQTTVRDDLKLLLELLESENRTDRIKDEKDRVRRYIRELQRIIRQQKSVQGRTESGADPQRLAEEEKKVAERTGRLAQEITENESPPNSGDNNSSDTSDSDSQQSGDAENQSGESKEPQDDSSDKEPSDKEPSDKETSDKEPSDKETSDKEPRDKEDGAQGNDDNPSDASKNGETDATKGTDGKQGEKGAESKPNSSDSTDADKQSDTDKNQSDTDKNSSEGNDSESKGQGQPNSDKPSESSDGQPSQQQPGQQQPGQQQPGQQQPGQQQPGQQQPGQQQSSPPQDEFPGKQRIAAAEEKMKEAAEKLQAAERDGAIEDQEEARRLLEQAKAELEEILRQLREEEIERTLAQLESRFRKMLAMQIAVYDDSKRLAKVPSAKRNKSFDIQASKLSLAERRIVEEADRAILLLIEEGSSVAFPEATEQMRGDMEEVSFRLAESKVGEMTIGLEEDIIAALEEMIEALQEAQKEAEEQKQQRQQQPPQQGAQEDQPLVNAIEELKMIRALQLRVNKRTARYAKMLADEEDLVGQLQDPDLLRALEELAGREERIRKITRDIVTGKTQ